MKTNFALVVFTVALLAAPALRAEDAKPGDEQARNRRGATAGRLPDPAERLKQLTEKLSLTTEQQEKVKAIHAKTADKLKALRDDKALTADGRREKLLEMRKAELEEINAILTPEQQTKFKELQRETRQRAGAGRRGRPEQKPEQK